MKIFAILLAVSFMFGTAFAQGAGYDGSKTQSGATSDTQMGTSGTGTMDLNQLSQQVQNYSYEQKDQLVKQLEDQKMLMTQDKQKDMDQVIDKVRNATQNDWERVRGEVQRKIQQMAQQQ